LTIINRPGNRPFHEAVSEGQKSGDSRVGVGENLIFGAVMEIPGYALAIIVAECPVLCSFDPGGINCQIIYVYIL